MKSENLDQQAGTGAAGVRGSFDNPQVEKGNTAASYPTALDGGCPCDICVASRRYAKSVQPFSDSAEAAQNQAEELLARAARNRRAAELLAKHPEFDDLLELLSIVPVNFIKAA